MGAHPHPGPRDPRRSGGFRQDPMQILYLVADRAFTKITQLLSDGSLVERSVDIFVAYRNIPARRRRPNPPGISLADLPSSHTLPLYHNATIDKIQGCKLLPTTPRCSNAMRFTIASCFPLVLVVWKTAIASSSVLISQNVSTVLVSYGGARK